MRVRVFYFIIAIFFISVLSVIFFNSQYIRNSREYAATINTASAVTTFASIGLYWSPPDGSPTNQCNVQYRVQGTTVWKQALPLWYDTRSVGGRSPEYRGSIVLLQPGTTYEIQLTLGSGTTTSLTATTWSENFPIAKTVTVPSGSSPYAITQGGSPTGYILYTSAPGGTTITVAPTNSDAITVSAPYVIIRGLTIKGGVNAINVTSGGHDVVIENNDISGWGKILSDGFGEEKDSAVFARGGSSIQRLIIQRNKMHDPNSNSNDWCESRSIYNEGTHPDGPQAVSLESIGGNHVIRYNEIYSTLNHSFNDGMGGQPQNAPPGFPNSDSDIYGNIIENIMDDAIESEGAVQNVRIWGNYIDQTWTGNATAITAVGPLYTFRNVIDRDTKCPRETGGYNTSGEHGPFGKQGDDSNTSLDGGRIYFFHNTLLQKDGGDGVNVGPSDYGNAPPKNMITRNNIWHGKSGSFAMGTTSQNQNDIDYDLMTSGPNTYSGAESHGIIGVPVYVAGEGDQNGPGGMYHLSPNSPGYHKGIVIPNFNDDFGSTPDMGAQQSGSPKMEFGVNAYLSSGPTPTIPASSPSTQPTSTQGTTFFLTLCPHGLGGCGDNVNPNAIGNTSPKHPQRIVQLTVFNNQNQQIATMQGTISYNVSSGNFQGVIIGNVPDAEYLVKVQTDGFLPIQIPGIISVTNGRQITFSPVSLVVGDINNDGQVDILDYNILIGCFGSKQTTASCTMPPTQQSQGADIDDDGNVGGSDYNLFLRELSVQHGA